LSARAAEDDGVARAAARGSGARPHVCFLAPHAYPVLAEDSAVEFAGGAELQQVLVARGLVGRGYRVSMISLDFGQPDRCEVDGIVVHKAFRPDAGIPVLRFVSPRLTGIWRCLKAVDADIVYQRGAGMITGVLAAFSRRHRARSIFAMAGATKIRFSRDRWLFEYGLRTVDCVVVQNRFQQELVRRETGREAVLIPNCYRPEPATGSGGDRGALWVSTIRHVKRPHLFLDLAEALPQHEFTMVGGRDLMDRALYEDVAARAARLPNVRFEGFVPYSQVHRYFDAAALFVNTSESEGFPNTFLQTWGRGKPTVSFVDSGARLDGRPVGRIVTSFGEMVEAVRTLLEDPAERAHLGALAREYVHSHHDLDRVLDLYEDLFRRLLAPRAAAGG
jgi:glycosyltransferase involved in cell wall biosynthesis